MGEVIEKSQRENIIHQPVFEHTSARQPIENNECVIYDAELENTLKIMKNNTGSFQTYEDLEHGWMWNGYFVKTLGGTEVQTNDKEIYHNSRSSKSFS